jgi:RNA polymerase sigma factor (sigma-70 family)
MARKPARLEFCAFMANPIIEELLAAYGELRRYLTRRLGNPDDAADATHDTVVRLMETSPGAIAQPRAYARRAAFNAATDAYRRRVAHEFLPLDAVQEPSTTSHDPESMLRASRFVAALEAALAELPPKCRQVFVWQRLDGLTQAEIAARLGLSKNMVEKYMIRAMRHLRERLLEFDSD